MLAIEVDPNLDSQMFRQDFDGLSFLLKFIWNDRDGAWYLELYTPEENLVASSILNLEIELFSEYRTRNTLPPGRFMAVDLRPGRNPFLREDLGVNIKLFYVTEAEYGALVGT